jgi:serine O-acetyltransferase
MLKTLLLLPKGMKIYLFLYFPIIIPFVFAYLCSNNKSTIKEDLLVRKENDNCVFGNNLILSLILCLIFEPEYRNVFYLRIGSFSRLLRIFLKPVSCMLGNDENIKGGLYIIHGYGTVINGSSHIGKNCTILQGVTIGVVNGKCPIIGDNVYIGAGAIIIGGVTIGNNVKIGAGAIVVDDVPDNSTCVCNKAHVIQKTYK